MLQSDLSGKSIVIVRMSAIGDVVHALPVACSLRAAVPDARISWLIQRAPYELIKHHPAVDEFIPFDRNPAWRGFRDLHQRLRSRRFDLALVLHTSFKASLATSLIHAPRKIGMDRSRSPELNWVFTSEKIPARPRGHVLAEAFEFLDYLGIPKRVEWGIGPTPEEIDRYRHLLPEHDGPTVALAVASSTPEKDWPPNRFAELADRLATEYGAKCVLVGGRSGREESVASTVLRLARIPPSDLRANDLRRLAYLLHRADVVVSPDSAPLHIGTALGTPSVALMGYTNPKRVGPTRFRELMLDAYGDPGEQYSASSGYRPGRMARIGVDNVVERVGQALTLRRAEPAPAGRELYYPSRRV